MKKAFLICALAAILAPLYAKAIREEVRLADEKTRLSYAFGLIMGAEFEPARLLDLDYSAFTDGLKASLEKGDAKLTIEEAYNLVDTALQAAMAKQGEENRLKEARFLSENSARPEIKTTASGLQYEVLVSGSGEKPARNNIVRVNYEGTLVDGTVFDSSYSRGESDDFPLDRVIPGWSEGLQLMDVGSKYRLYIPSSLAYGEAGAGPVIPPYSTLIFTVELLEILGQADEEEQD